MAQKSARHCFRVRPRRATSGLGLEVDDSRVFSAATDGGAIVLVVGGADLLAASPGDQNSG